MKKKLGMKNTGYTDEHGLRELVERSEDLLLESAVCKTSLVKFSCFSVPKMSHNRDGRNDRVK